MLQKACCIVVTLAKVREDSGTIKVFDFDVIVLLFICTSLFPFWDQQYQYFRDVIAAVVAATVAVVVAATVVAAAVVVVVVVAAALDGDDVNDGDDDEVDTEDAGITCTWSL